MDLAFSGRNCFKRIDCFQSVFATSSTRMSGASSSISLARNASRSESAPWLSSSEETISCDAGIDDVGQPLSFPVLSNRSALRQNSNAAPNSLTAFTNPFHQRLAGGGKLCLGFLAVRQLLGCSAHKVHPSRLSSSSLSCFGLLHFLNQWRNDVEQVAYNRVISDLENRSLRIFVHGDDRPRALHPNDVLNRAADAERQVQLGRDGLPG